MHIRQHGRTWQLLKTSSTSMAPPQCRRSCRHASSGEFVYRGRGRRDQHHQSGPVPDASLNDGCLPVFAEGNILPRGLNSLQAFHAAERLRRGTRNVAPARAASWVQPISANTRLEVAMVPLLITHSSVETAGAARLTRQLQFLGYLLRFRDLQVEIPGSRWSERENSQPRKSDAVVFLAGGASTSLKSGLAELCLARSTDRAIIPVRRGGRLSGGRGSSKCRRRSAIAIPAVTVSPRVPRDTPCGPDRMPTREGVPDNSVVTADQQP